MMRYHKDLSIVIPAYNEKENVQELIVKAKSILDKLVDNYEIIIVNDGSTDKTEDTVKELMDDKIHLINHGLNRGYGASLRTGFSNSKYNLIFYTDADNQFDLNELEKLLGIIDDSDIVIGYRLNRQESFFRLLTTKTYNLTIRLLFGLWVKDVDCAFKIFKREIFDKIEIKSNSFLVNLEVLVKAKKAGFKIKEVGVHHYSRKFGKSTVNVTRILTTIFDMFRFRFGLI